VATTVCLLPLHTGRGCSGHPAFPAPFDFLGRFVCKTRAHHVARMRTCVYRHCERSEAIQAIIGALDCFVAEPVIGRAFARPVGSSQ
jgi:hypothetical protein